MLERIQVIKNEGFSFLACVASITFIPLLPEYFAPVLAIASLFFAAADARSRGTTIQVGPLGKLLLLYIAYMAIGILYSAHTMNSLATVAMWLVMFFLYVSLTTVLHNRRRIHFTLFLVAVVAGAVGGIACLQYLYRMVFGKDAISNQVWLRLDEFVYKYFPIEINLDMGTNRSASTFTNPNMLAEALILLLPLTVAVMLLQRRLIHGFGGVLCVAAVLFFAAVVSCITAFAKGRRASFFTVTLPLLFAVFGAVYFMAYTDRIGNTIEKYTREDSHSIEAVVISRSFVSNYLSIYDVRTSKLDGENVNIKMRFEVPFFLELEGGDVVRASVTLSDFDNSDGFDQKQYYNSKGYFFLAEWESGDIVCLEKKSSPELTLSKLRSSLADVFYSGLDEEHAGLFTAVFLGDRSGLSDTAKRDFRRTGGYHLLADALASLMLLQ